MNMPAFGFQTPAFNQAQAQAPAQAQPGYAAPAPAPAVAPQYGIEAQFSALATAEIFDSGKPRLTVGNYTVQFKTAMLKNTRDHGPALIVEYIVLDSDNGTPPGTESSYFRTTKPGDMVYIAKWLCDLIGARTEIDRATAKTLLPQLIAAMVENQTKMGPRGEQVSSLIGQRFRLSIQPGSKPSKKTGKLYDQEYWAPAG